MNIKRCEWAKSEADIKYHDNEWGKPDHDDKYLFEMLILEGFQAGLSWSTILNKRDNFKKAFDNFDYKKIAGYSDEKLESLMQDSGIIRNRLKIFTVRKNAIAFIDIQKEFGSFDKYIWGFVGNKQIVNNWKSIYDVPAKTELSDKISKDLKKRGFSFVGTTIIYSFLQAVGIIDDHIAGCQFKTK
jgi:DNA-3-methyladenine glycosylase I